MEYILLAIALAGIVFGADSLVSGAVSIARKYKVSDFVIGAAIVGIGTSMPELVVSFIGAIHGNADVAIGNVVGSNIFNVLGILGVTAIFSPIAIDKDNIKFEIPLCITISALLAFLALGFGEAGSVGIGRTDGILLLSIFAFFMWHSFHRDRKKSLAVENRSKNEVNIRLGIAALKVIGGLALLIFSCDIFIDNAVKIARSFGVNDAFISLTLIACGTSLPEMAASIAAALKKNTQMALGNIIGSNIFNISLILGLSSQVTLLTSAGIGIVDYAVMTTAATAPLVFWLHKGRISRTGGTLMFLCFVSYTIWLIGNQTA